MKNKKTLCLSLLLAGGMSYCSPAMASGILSRTIGATESKVADSKSVKGIIIGSDGQPVIGASIKEQGTNNIAVSNVDGEFKLTVEDSSHQLIVSYLGYLTAFVKPTGDMKIILKEDTKTINEVVVLGYGANARKQDLSASVGVIHNTDKLAQMPVTSAESMLQGQLAGVTISSDGGDPTKSPNMVIRGQGSQNGDNVLWVVDGIPGAPISSLNDIESIFVLKDAASAAIYGAQSGAGGVVLVTTKKAKKGMPSLTYEGTYGMRKAYNLPKPLNAEQEIEMRKISYANAGMSLPNGWDPEKNPWIKTTRTDWMKEIFRDALYQRHNVSMNVGTDTFRSRLSYSFSNDEGVLINTYNRTSAFHYNGELNLNKWVTISQDLTWKNSSQRGTDTDSGYTGSVLAAIMMPASANVYNPLDGSYAGVTTEDPAYIEKYGSNFADAHGDAANPVRLLKADTNYNRTSETWSTTSLQIHDIIPGLKLTSRFTYNLVSYYYKNFTPIRDEVGKPMNFNTLVESTYRTSQWKTENTLTYDNTFGLHTVGALLSTTADHYAQRGFSVTANGFANESAYLQYLAFAGSHTAADYLNGPDANVSLVSRLAYSYDDRYFITASWRRDYAGRLPKANNHGDFPAVTGAWKISNEKFFPKNDAVNLLKLRASWGRVGNLGSIGMNYKTPLLVKQENTDGAGALWGVPSGVKWGTAVYYGKALNPNLTWETSEQTDAGIDLELLKNRLNLSLDYFYKRTYNLIQTQSMGWPSTIGLEAMLVNMGEVKNRGLEITASWNDRLSRNFSYFVNANFSTLKNWVSNIGAKNPDGTPGVWTSDTHFRNLDYVYQTTEGQPLNSFYLVKTAGIFQSDEEAANYKDKNGNRIQPNAKAGDLKFIDANGDGKIDNKDRQYCGSAMPKTTFAFTLGFTWKDLSASAMFQGVGGAKAFYIAKSFTQSDYEGSFNRDSKILNAWSETNKSSNLPRLQKNDPNGNFTTMSDWYLEDASYLRLKNLTVSYDLTNIIRKWAHLNGRGSRLSVYFSGENLFTITDYSGMDPEVGGWDAMKYPVSRVYSFGVKLTY